MEKRGAFLTSFGRVEHHAIYIFVGDLKSLQYSIRKVTDLLIEVKTVSCISIFVVSAIAKYYLPWIATCQLLQNPVFFS